MHKKFSIALSIISAFMLTATMLCGCRNKAATTSKDGKALVKVRLNEVTRSIFYAPLYASLSKGYFKDEGLDIDLTTGGGADKTMQQVLSNSSDIGFCGPEQVIYIYNQKRDDYPILFAQLTQKDGSFLVGRTKQADFSFESLKGKTVVGGRPGGVPEMSFEYVLKNHGLTPGKDINVITNIAFDAVAGAFKGGTGDYATLFEPTGSMFEKDNAGYIVASVGKEAGTIPYTCFFAAKSYIEKNPEIISKFTKAIYEGQLWIFKTDNKEIAQTIKAYFPGSDEDIITNCIKNYKDIKAYASDPTLKEEDLSRLMDIIQGYKADLIQERPPYDKIVTTKYAKDAINSVK